MGGINSSDTVITKDPGLEPVATGGFSPVWTAPGQATMPADNTFSIGQMDLVVRVSRARTIWFEVRLTFTSNAETNQTPRLDALGFAYSTP